jgi:hypothetical protein
MKAGVVCFFMFWTMTLGSIFYLALNESKKSFEQEKSALQAELHELMQENLFLEDEVMRVTKINCMVFDLAKNRSAWLFRRAWNNTSDWTSTQWSSVTAQLQHEELIETGAEVVAQAKEKGKELFGKFKFRPRSNDQAH